MARYRITTYERHPLTREPGVIISYEQTRGRWQLVRSCWAKTADDPILARFLAWAKQRYPQARVRAR